MSLPKLVLSAAVALATVAIVAPEADAWRWRRWRSKRTTTNTYQTWQQGNRSSTGSLRNYSGISRSEYDYWRRRDAWRDHAYNGFDPLDHR